MGIRVRDVRDHLASLDTEEAPVENVDGVEAGSLDAAVDRVAVAWMPYERTVERAADAGCDLLVTHEPLLYHTGATPDPDAERDAVSERMAAKRSLVEERGLTVLRCHDAWDLFPGEGVTDTWGDLLGFADAGETVASEDYVRVYDLPERRARDVAERIADRVADLGQSAVELVGSGDTLVSRVAIGTGAITPVPRFLDEYDPDMLVCSDDGFTYWRDGAIAVDAGVPVVVVNHATAEVASMATLASHLDDAFPDLGVTHFDQDCMFELVSGRDE